jgi:hypothetical protein
MRETSPRLSGQGWEWERWAGLLDQAILHATLCSWTDQGNGPTRQPSMRIRESTPFTSSSSSFSSTPELIDPLVTRKGRMRATEATEGRAMDCGALSLAVEAGVDGWEEYRFRFTCFGMFGR